MGTRIYMYVGAVPDAHRFEGASGDQYMATVPTFAHRPKGAGGDPYMYVGAGPGAHGS